MTTIVSPKLRRLVRDLGKAIVLRFAGRDSWSRAEYQRILYDELGKYDLNHADFRADIARTFVTTDLAERCNHNPFKVTTERGDRIDISRLEPADFARGVIRLGDGNLVRMADATYRHWNARLYHQQQAAQAAQQSATRTTMFLQTEAGLLLLDNPRLKTQNAMCQLDLWTADDVREADDTDDDPVE